MRNDNKGFDETMDQQQLYDEVVRCFLRLARLHCL